MSITEKLKRLAAAPPEPAERSEPSPPEVEERKARAHRLIQIGAITDQYLETSGSSPEEVRQLLLELVQLPTVYSTMQQHRRPD